MLGIVERVAETLERSIGVDRVFEHVTEKQENLCATPPARRLLKRLLEQFARGSQVADALLKRCNFEKTVPVFRTIGWAGPEGGGGKLGSNTGCATLARPHHGVVERQRDTLVGACRRSSKVSSPVFDVARALCEFGMNGTALERRRRGVYRGREQRMRETHGIAGALHELAFDGKGEGLVGQVGSVTPGRQAQELAPRLCRQAADAGEDGVDESRRNAHGVGDVAVLAPTCNALAHNLERVKRMAAGKVRDSLDVVAAEDFGRGLYHDFPNRLVGERSHRELRELGIEIETRAAGQESRDTDIEPAEGETDAGPGRRICPLNIVDRDKGDAVARGLAQEIRERSSHNALVENAAVRLFEQQCDAQRPPLRFGESADLVVDTRQEVAQCCEGEFLLRFRGLCTQHPEAVVLCIRRCPTPQRRLADPRLALQNQRASAAGPGLEKFVDRSDLELAPEDPGHDQRYSALT